MPILSLFQRQRFSFPEECGQFRLRKVSLPTRQIFKPSHWVKYFAMAFPRHIAVSYSIEEDDRKLGNHLAVAIFE